MTRKELIRAVQNDLKAGKDRQQVFKDYQSQFPKPLQLATVIAGTAREEDKKKYQVLNLVLVALLVLGGLSKVLTVWMLAAGTSAILAVVLSAVALLISFAFAYEVNRFTGAMYGLLTVLAVVSLINALLNFRQDVIGTGILVMFLGGIAFLSVFLRQKLFPALKLFGVKTDGSGQYLLG